MNKLNAEAEEYFEELRRNRKATEAASLFISNILDQALNDDEGNGQNIPLLLSLITYIEFEDGEMPYKYIGETHRILRILYIIRMEQKYQMSLFCTGCGSGAALMEKYMLTLFALRRLLFHLSDASVEDAVFYLKQNPVSVFAVYMMAQDDLIRPDQTFYQEIARLYSTYWSDSEQELFHSLIQTS